MPAHMEQHLTYRDIMRILNVGKSKAYDIIHECEAKGFVISDKRTLRLAVSGFEAWYAEHITGQDAYQQRLSQLIADGEKAVAAAKRRPGRPRKELWKNG